MYFDVDVCRFLLFSDMELLPVVSLNLFPIQSKCMLFCLRDSALLAFSPEDNALISVDLSNLISSGSDI